MRCGAATLGTFALVLIICGLAVTPTARPASGGSPVTWTVNSTADDDDGVCGFAAEDCTLREAINALNAGIGGSIRFNIGTGTPRIDILTQLPAIQKSVNIDGASGGATRVELHGPGALPAIVGLSLGQGAAVSYIQNLVINNFLNDSGLNGAGILIGAEVVTVTGSLIGTNAEGTAAVPNRIGIYIASINASIGGTNGVSPGSCTGECNLISGNTTSGIIAGIDGAIRGNFVGTDVTGSAAIPNATGILANVDRNGNLIGGAVDGAGNLISGNGFGIDSQGTMTIQGNRIGTNSAGTAAIPNVDGITLGPGTATSLVGGPKTAAANLISGNQRYALALRDTQVTVQGNLIGTQADGTSPLPNGTTYLPGTVVPLGGPENAGAIDIVDSHSTIGGYNSDEPNTIAFNIGNGVRASGPGAFYNFIIGNSIHSNTVKGIELVDGANMDIPPPVILSADSTGASGTVSGPTCPPCGVSIYSDDEDEGRVYEGTVIADMNGNWTFTGSLDGPNITATAHDDGGDTSEFSVPFNISPATPTPSPSPSPTSSASPTPTPTPTSTSTSTPSPTPTGAGQQVAWGDHNCSGSPDPIDGLLNLRHDAGLPTETGDCPEMGTEVDVQNASLHLWGDFDCSELVDPVDALKLLRFDAGLDVARPSSCPDPGQTVTVQ